MTPTAEEKKIDVYRNVFMEDFGVHENAWAWGNVKRLLTEADLAKGDADEVKRLLEVSGMREWRYPSMDGVWDHGEVWARQRVWCIVGHPYDIQPYERDALIALTRFPQFRVSIDDRPSHYGYGTHHVRVQLAEPRDLPGGSMVLDDSLLMPLDV